MDWVVFLILNCMSCLYILEINPLSVTSFPNIFSHSVGCLFILTVFASILVAFMEEQVFQGPSSAILEVPLPILVYFYQHSASSL